MSRVSVLSLLGLMSLLGGSLAYPSSSNTNMTIFKDPETGLKYFWYPNEDGDVYKAFLEGGPEIATPKGVEDSVQFFLYTKNNPSVGHELKPDCNSCIDGSHFNRNAPVKIVSHGFMSDYQSNINTIMKNAYLGRSDFVNVIILNWEKLAAAPWYDTAAGNTLGVGIYVAQFVNFLVSSGYTTFDKVHFSGHSLGSHVAGSCGSNTNQKIARITALDPALPLFGEKPDSQRIDPSDANFVDTIHTAGGSLAFQEPRGHVDLYPNNGQSFQPGCGIDIIATCSHSRAYEFMAESILHTNGFPAYKCTNWDEYNSGRCSMTDKIFMGEPCSPSARGNYYLRTNQNPPFGQE